MLLKSKLNQNAKKLNGECKLEMTNTKCTIDCAKYNVKWNIEFWRKWNAIVICTNRLQPVKGGNSNFRWEHSDRQNGTMFSMFRCSRKFSAESTLACITGFIFSCVGAARKVSPDWSQKTMKCHSFNCFSIVWGQN